MSSDECPTQHEIILETGIVVRNFNVFCVLTEVLKVLQQFKMNCVVFFASVRFLGLVVLSDVTWQIC